MRIQRKLPNDWAALDRARVIINRRAGQQLEEHAARRPEDTPIFNSFPFVLYIAQIRLSVQVSFIFDRKVISVAQRLKAKFISLLKSTFLNLLSSVITVNQVKRSSRTWEKDIYIAFSILWCSSLYYLINFNDLISNMWQCLSMSSTHRETNGAERRAQFSTLDTFMKEYVWKKNQFSSSLLIQLSLPNLFATLLSPNFFFCPP